MNSARLIAETLDRHLDQKTEIVVFGSAALLLDPRIEPLMDGRRTDDIDVVIPNDHEMAVDTDVGFWSAIEATNRELDSLNLYISHIFAERQVVLPAPPSTTKSEPPQKRP